MARSRVLWRPCFPVQVNIPADPWASLHRTYGPSCGDVARLTEHGGYEADLRDPKYARLKQPAAVRTGGPGN